MRRFRLIKLDEAYEPLKQGYVYDSDLIPDGWSETIGQTAQRFPNEWNEVIEITDSYLLGKEETKSLHKETDLGYFAGLAMQGILSNPDPNAMPLDEKHAAKLSIIIAKELIKQLNEETK